MSQESNPTHIGITKEEIQYRSQDVVKSGMDHPSLRVTVPHPWDNLQPGVRLSQVSGHFIVWSRRVERSTS